MAKSFKAPVRLLRSARNLPTSKHTHKMPTGIGSRKVLTPRSSKVPRRSLPPQAKLIEAASFDSFDSQPSSPDIMTTKLLEKVKAGKKTANNSTSSNTASNTTASNLNQRLKEAAASNSLAANSGRSKLSTEEFKLADESEDLAEKYKKSAAGRDKDYSMATKSTGAYTSGYNNNTTTSNNSYNSSYSSGYNTSSNIKPNNTTSATSASSYMPSSSYNRPDYSNISYHQNNSFERFNTSISNSGESVEMLQEQVAHLRREYDGLKQRFNELSRLRLSEPEEFLEEHKKLSEARDLAAEKTIKALQKENETLKKQLEESNKKKEKESTSVIGDTDSSSDNEQGKADLEFMSEVEKILKIYSSFSGLKITPEPGNPLTQWHCEFSSRSGQFNFQLTYEASVNKYQYVPLDDMKGQLPAFLASDILVAADQMQLFFWRLLDTLSKQQPKH